MGEQRQSGFGQFIPGFDFLQNLAQGASASLPQLPNLSNWVAPTLDVAELEKRIGELKAVQFWLQQNTHALNATIQALEVQKMTLATLKGMNFSMQEVAESMKVQPQAAGAATRASAPRAAKGAAGPDAPAGGKAPGDGKVVDPLQWWGALTRQFQEIAANAMQEVATSTEGQPAAGAAKRPAKGGAGRAAAAKRPPRKQTSG
ncbi:PhaM family polyhydroxyalkanoate granule multifunctional regulatory protein [Ramlibacter sp.]|uniref:PhaM family polyhydroxyalkanoate granule multifunctional regulatory protein n=1 Tax=Ramlibacter sp. TaxID=1917967 RepID=UPI002C489905|nr:PhaM family polyhydroxyalkanoate granule multifunctional regulatory protein [Ramlibacter sp.]HWI82783.1 PhaM family polyhydroxyalkanoate granule multifunctional regulatory protein [Ramlibacter sp.]